MAKKQPKALRFINTLKKGYNALLGKELAGAVNKKAISAVNSIHTFKKGDCIYVHDKMQSGYSYILAESPGTGFLAEFQPYFSPAQMLRLGVFGGKYLSDCLAEFPAEWFTDAIALEKLSPQGTNIQLNLFQIDSRLPLSEWHKKGIYLNNIFLKMGN